MKIIHSLIINIIVCYCVIFASEGKLAAKSTKLTGQGIKKSNINLTVEAEDDIYGIQFDIMYNEAELFLSENSIISKIQGVNIYSRVKEKGIARVLMFGMTGEKLLDVNNGRIADLIDIQFQPAGKFRGTSIVELKDIILAGKAGIEIGISRSSAYTFEVSFLSPQKTSLSKNYPNPFNPSTTIEYELSDEGIVSLIVYDLKGAVVRTLVNNKQEANYHNVIWDGLNDNGQAVASGRYIIKMSAPDFSDTITMTLLK